MQLQIWHIGEAEGLPLFQVRREGAVKPGDTVQLTSPNEFAVEGYTTNLQQGLRWYMEQYLSMPIGEFSVYAQAVLDSLQRWGKECFERLFNKGGLAQDWYRAAGKNLQLKIASHCNDPMILSWPWEALRSNVGNLALQCHLESQLAEDIDDPRTPETPLSSEQLNILYIIARPDGEDDVGFHTLVQPIIECARKHKHLVHIDLLRPPTFDQLRKVLDEKPDFYHIVHFDGHGLSGALAFETEDGAEQPAEIIDSETLGELLCEYNIPVMTLNACRSAMQDESKDSYVSVAIGLIRAGVRSVVAMRYNLLVSGAQAFVASFYEKLFAEGNISEAMRTGRKEMYRKKMRDSFMGKVEFQDWIVPILYQNTVTNEQILPRISAVEDKAEAKNPLPQEAQLDRYGLIGRDRAIQKLERLMLKKPAGILIHGMAGEGKTTLAKGFLQWLQDTNGLGHGAFWFSFEGLRGAEYIFNELSEALGLPLEAPLEQRLPVLIRILKEHPFVLVWDNFESASGIAGTEVEAQMPEADRAMLKRFLHGLYNGRSKVLITSRSTEEWLKPEILPLALGGLEGEELWQYCNRIVEDLDLNLRRDKDYKDLMDELGGNPLAVRTILLRLPGRSAKALLAEVRASFANLEGDESVRRIQSALEVFNQEINPSFKPILRLVGLHDMHVDADHLEGMLKQTASEAVASLPTCFTMLESAGLCRHLGNNIYKTHPALRTWLERQHPAGETEQRVFVDYWGTLADHYAPKELHEQRGFFELYRANLRRALEMAKALEQQADVDILIQAFALYALNNRNFDEAERQYLTLRTHCAAPGKGGRTT